MDLQVYVESEYIQKMVDERVRRELSLTSEGAAKNHLPGSNPGPFSPLSQTRYQ